MNIMVINHYAGSTLHGMNYRSFYLAKEMINLGHNVTIVTASFSHSRLKQPTVSAPLTEEDVDGVRFIWLKTPQYHGNGLMRAVSFVAFPWQLIRFRQELIDLVKPDVVICSSPQPVPIYASRMIATDAKAKLVFEIRDLWALEFTEIKRLPAWHPVVLLIRGAENYGFRNADIVVSLLSQAESYMTQNGMRGKFVYIPNGVNLSEWNEDGQTAIPQEHRETIAKLKQEGKFIVGFAGTHGEFNALDNLVAAAAMLKDKPFAFILVGEGVKKADLQKTAREQKLDNVYFLPRVPKSCIPRLLGAMDALFIGLDKKPVYMFGVSPNKLMDYMMAAKPIIHAIEAGNDPVRDSGCGYSIPADDCAALAEAIQRLAGLSADELRAMGEKGRKFVELHYDYKALANNYIAALNPACK